jgi:hypothetical protein
MKVRVSLLLIFIAILSACADNNAINNAELVGVNKLAEVTGPPESRPMSGSAQGLAIESDLLPAGCVENAPGVERPNSGVADARGDGAEYLAASQRVDGWQIQFDCPGNPGLIVNVVATYATLEGAAITLSRRWHGEVWERLDAGTLEQLDPMPGLGDLQIVFQDANGTIGVEFVYRSSYFFLTGTSVGGEDNYEFFSTLANEYLAEIKSLN